MSMKSMRWAVEANKNMSDFEVMKAFVEMLYLAFGMAEEVIKADLADASESELRHLLASLA